MKGKILATRHVKLRSNNVFENQEPLSLPYKSHFPELQFLTQSTFIGKEQLSRYSDTIYFPDCIH